MTVWWGKLSAQGGIRGVPPNPVSIMIVSPWSPTMMVRRLVVHIIDFMTTHTSRPPKRIPNIYSHMGVHSLISQGHLQLLNSFVTASVQHGMGRKNRLNASRRARRAKQAKTDPPFSRGATVESPFAGPSHLYHTAPSTRQAAIPVVPMVSLVPSTRRRETPRVSFSGLIQAIGSLDDGPRLSNPPSGDEFSTNYVWSVNAEEKRGLTHWLGATPSGFTFEHSHSFKVARITGHNVQTGKRFSLATTHIDDSKMEPSICSGCGRLHGPLVTKERKLICDQFRDKRLDRYLHDFFDPGVIISFDKWATRISHLPTTREKRAFVFRKALQTAIHRGSADSVRHMFVETTEIPLLLRLGAWAWPYYWFDCWKTADWPYSTLNIGPVLYYRIFQSIQQLLSNLLPVFDGNRPSVAPIVCRYLYDAISLAVMCSDPVLLEQFFVKLV
jgi:hypothetical protein